MAVHVVLLRGINVGRSPRIAMPELRAALEAAGFNAVRTHVQSGNVVLRSGDSGVEVGRRVGQVMRDSFDADVGVMVRTAAELDEVIAGDPLAEVADDLRNHVVFFCSDEVDRASVADLEDAFAPERLFARGRELYAWCPGGQGRSPMLAELGKRKLGVQVTARNWNTVTKLQAMAAEVS